MNYTKKALFLLLCCAMGSLHAINKPRAKSRSMTNSQISTTNTKVVKPRQQKQQMSTPPTVSYKQIHDAILQKKQANVFTGNAFNPQFLKDISAQVEKANISAEGFVFLLQTARDKFAPFTGNNANDLTLLEKINKEIATVTMFKDL